ncbi:hypothetical protein DDA93_03355 [Arthrobacter sp. Bz4]|nr:hypothetical protein DDA93_03355 [Arthrobacter sp. Bz4]
MCRRVYTSRVLPAKVMLEEAYFGNNVEPPLIRNLLLRQSAYLVLMSYLDHRIEQLIAVRDDSGNTGAKGIRSA